MNARILYLIAALLALAAAAIYFFRAGPDEDPMLRIVLLIVLGLAMLWLSRRSGSRRSD